MRCYRVHAHGRIAYRDKALRHQALREHRRLPVPTSCLYSLGDGVVPPQEATIDGDAALHEILRVPGSHIGLGVNGLVLAVVADRLAQPEEAWQPFKPTGLLARVWRVLPKDKAPDLS